MRARVCVGAGRRVAGGLQPATNREKEINNLILYLVAIAIVVVVEARKRRVYFFC